MKICPCCGENRTANHFHADKSKSSGLASYCKICTKANNKANYAKNIDKRKAVKKQYREDNVDKVALAKKKWQDENPEKLKATIARYWENHPEKRLAHRAVNNAVRDGRIVKPFHCEKCCSDEKIEAHHESYDKCDWLNVKWLCRKCHKSVHAKVEA